MFYYYYYYLYETRRQRITKLEYVNFLGGGFTLVLFHLNYFVRYSRVSSGWQRKRRKVKIGMPAATAAAAALRLAWMRLCQWLGSLGVRKREKETVWGYPEWSRTNRLRNDREEEKERKIFHRNPSVLLRAREAKQNVEDNC